MQGYSPQIATGTGNPEAQKYGRLWSMPQYRAVAPGEMFAELFLVKADPKVGSHIIDFGCGTGRGAKKLHDAGMKVAMLDFARNCLDDEVRGALSGTLVFKKHDLTNPSPVIAEYGYCTDVMEHIPPDAVDCVLENILRAAKNCFFAISTTEDVCGRLIGETLHVSLHDFAWWAGKFSELHCRILWSEESNGYAHFLVSAWEDAQIVVDNGTINATEELIRDNIRKNCEEGYQQIIPHPEQDTEIMILGGGPSLSDHADDIRAKRAEGVKLVTLNGAYNWAIENGLTPSATIIVDAREFNKRFTKPVVDGCKYLIASQCHPAVLEGLPKARTYLWHVMGDLTDSSVAWKYFPAHWPIPGGSTVLLRAIPLLRMMGYHRFHLYGCDSCLADKAHHAYLQPENDDRAIVPLMVTGGRTFFCHPWMAAQAREFVTMIQKLGETFDMIVHGDGLLAHIINTGARIAPEREG
jgi:SAM-dependent methyltransferase